MNDECVVDSDSDACCLCVDEIVMAMLLVMEALGMVMVMVMVMLLVMAMAVLVMVGVTEEPNRVYCSLSLAGFFTGRAHFPIVSALTIARLLQWKEPLLSTARLCRRGRA